MTTRATLLAAFCLSFLLFPAGASTGCDSCAPPEPAVLVSSQGEPGSPVADQATQPGLIGINARITSQPDLPFRITRVLDDSSPVTRETYLIYTVANQGVYPLTQLDLLILALNSNGKPRAGEKLREMLDVPPGEIVQRRLRLSNLLYTDHTRDYVEFVVAVVGAQTGPVAWQQPFPPDKLIEALNSASALPMQQSAAGTASECPAICLECRDLALNLCGAGCVASFRCSRSACTCEFTCKPNCPHPG